MALADTLRLWGILRPEITIAAAEDAGLEIAAACVVLMKETGGGRMIWGSDGRWSDPPARRTDARGVVIYEFGGPVTKENYLRYRDAMRAKLIPRQGVGDCQLTSAEYQDRGDQLGGCWDPYANQRAGFTGLARLIRTYGDQQGFRRYNGAGPKAEAYAVKAVGQLATWRLRLGAQPSPSAVAANRPPPAPIYVPEDDDMRIPIERIDAAGRFHEAVGAEAGGGSRYAAHGAITFGSTYGATTWTAVCALGSDGSVLGYWPDVRTNNNTNATLDLPEGTRCVTFEGQIDNSGTRPWASYWPLP